MSNPEGKTQFKPYFRRFGLWNPENSSIVTHVEIAPQPWTVRLGANAHPITLMAPCPPSWPGKPMRMYSFVCSVQQTWQVSRLSRQTLQHFQHPMSLSTSAITSFRKSKPSVNPPKNLGGARPDLASQPRSPAQQLHRLSGCKRIRSWMHQTESVQVPEHPVT